MKVSTSLRILVGSVLVSFALSFSHILGGRQSSRDVLQGQTFCYKYSRLRESRSESKSGEDENKVSNESSHGPSLDDEKQQAASFKQSVEDKERRKTQIAKAAAQIIKRNVEDERDGLLEKLNPFQAGKNFRKSLDSALSSLARAGSGVSSDDRKKSLYYLDDRFQESGGALFTSETNPYLARLDKENYVPEVLVVGATGEVGRLVVRRLLLEGRSRVRVLVRDLYSKTLNMLGTGVVYCQGDLSNMDSLEYALTDVDKIVVCAAAPRPDEEQFKEKFLGFAKDNLENDESALGKINTLPYKEGKTHEDETESDMEFDRLESVLKIRAKLAEQVDLIGMQNLVKAYQNVRHADYGTSQAAKRSLFKFRRRPDDFNLFAIDESEGEDSPFSLPNGAREEGASKQTSPNDKLSSPKSTKSRGNLAYQGAGDTSVYDEYAHEYDKYADEYDRYSKGFEAFENDDAYEGNDALVGSRQGTSVKTQLQWIRNEFGSGVFVGKVPGSGGEAAIISSRLRSRDGGPDDGIDLSSGFGGFVCRVCADGSVYEAFIRNRLYEEKGIEFVCEFSTASKEPQKSNASRNKFTTVRLPFESFKPVKRQSVKRGSGSDAIPPFEGSDVRQMGFRFRSSRNPTTRSVSRSKRREGDMKSFYLALSYVKLYRIQPEPEFVYLSDARIPPKVLDRQVRHDIHQLTPVESLSTEEGGVQIFDDKALQRISSDRMARSPEETYYKYRGEQVLLNSGLSYAIVRVSGYNESPSSEASTIELKLTNDDIKPVSRAEAAQVCVSALLEPSCLNKCFYLSKKDKQSGANIDESLTEKFRALS